MSFEGLLAVYFVAGLSTAVMLCSAGIYAAISGRNSFGAEDQMKILGFLWISSRGGALGLIFAGISLFALCLIFLSRIALR